MEGYTLVYVFVKSAKQIRGTAYIGTQSGWQISPLLLPRFSPPHLFIYNLIKITLASWNPDSRHFVI
jgi:hypothetical protein